MYLNKVAISNFRAFPSDFTLDLTPGPGVTLILGQNGLGKSTFIEALEWCLTGDVKRLKDIPPEGSKKADVLARRMSNGKEADRYGVEMLFQPDAGVKFSRWREREGTTYKHESEPQISDLVNALKAPSWKEPILELGSYLRLTHFLSQAGEQRFASQESKDRWSALEAPAGTERLNKLREKLGNKGVTAAFNRRLKECQDAISLAQAELSRWEELLISRDNASILAESGGAVSPSELMSQVEEIRLELKQDQPSFSFSDQQSIEKCLKELFHGIDKGKLRISAEQDALAAIKTHPRQWRQLLTDIAITKATVESIGKRQNELIELIAKNTEESKKGLTEQQAVALKRHEITISQSQLARFSGALRMLNEQHAVEATLNKKLEVANKELTKATSLAAMNQRLVEDRRRLDRDYKAAFETAASIKELHLLHVLQLQLQKEADTANTALQEFQSISSHLQGQIKTADDTRAEATVKLREAEQRLNRIRFHSNTTDTCIAALASVITEDDTRCPVCTTTFEPGILKKLVSMANLLTSDALTAAESAVAQLKLSVSNIESLKASLLDRFTTNDQAIKGANATIARAEANKAVFSRNPLVAKLPFDTKVDEWIAILLVDSQEQVDKATAAIKLAVSLAECERSATETEIARIALASMVSELQASLEKARSAVANAQIVVSEVRIQDQPLETYLESEGRKLSISEGECLATHDILSKNIVQLSISKRLLENELDSLNKQKITATNTSEEQNRLMGVLRNSWLKAGLKGEPSDELLQIQIESNASNAKHYGELDYRYRSALESLTIWKNADQFRKHEVQIAEYRQRYSQTNNADVTSALTKKVGDARLSEEQCLQARTFRDKMIDQLQTEARQYANKVLAPLNSLNESFLQVFSCFSNMSVSLGAKTHQASVKLEMNLNWLAGSETGNSTASFRHFLSEGQLSALSVSLLLSMSTAYKWSRWRSLIMDDPLQHNDVIHATSFIEIIRNLVRYQGYQVILSTHDLDLAGFILRKMVAAEVDCRTCTFLGTHSNGVRYKVS